jgi:hypothetical protein
VEPLGVGVGEGADQNSVDDTEHRRVDADSDGERERRRDRKHRRAPEHADGIARILERRLEANPDVGLARPVAQRRVVAKEPPRRAAGVVGVQALALEVCRAHLDVELQLRVDLIVEPPPLERVREPSPPGHRDTPQPS